jgi:hypothetical protein
VGGCGAGGVVLIRSGDDDTTLCAADEGVAVMVVDPAVSWSELAAIIYGLVLEGRETRSDNDRRSRPSPVRSRCAARQSQRQPR